MKFLVEIYVDADPLTSVDTVDFHLSRMSSALELFASAYKVHLSGDATGSWANEFTWKEVQDA
jgi:hypothetical protein